MAGMDCASYCYFCRNILSEGVGYTWPNHKNNIYVIIIIWITLMEIVVCLELKMLSFIQEQRKIQKYISFSFCIGWIAGYYNGKVYVK